MYRTTQPRGETRPGVILVVVLSLLGLFAVVALTFVLYADSAASAARANRDSETTLRANAEPELLLSYFLGQMIYDVKDDDTGVYSALRGHSLARTMYGLNDGLPNANPFNGFGPLHYAHGATEGVFNGLDDYYFPNFTYFPADSRLRDPERFGSRANLSAAKGTYTAWNGSYTYPDRTNMFLAAVDANGQVTKPSFHRPELATAAGVANPWTDPKGKYVFLRPRQADHAATFPDQRNPSTGADEFDVKNWTAAPGGNDSVWIDLGFPVLTAPDGVTKFKPLFAPLVIDLDNRINLLTAGNIASGGGHGSMQGWGPWEASLEKLFGGGTEWKQLFSGRTTPFTVQGKYGSDNKPGKSGSIASDGTAPRFYAQVNYSGQAAQWSLPTAGSPAGKDPAYASFPQFTSGFNNGNTAERTDHPLLYNPLAPRYNPLGAVPDDLPFRLSNQEALLRFGESNSPALTADPFRLADQTFQSNPALRRLVTLRSFDTSRPGATPWVVDPTTPATLYTYTAGNAAPNGSSVASPAGGPFMAEGDFANSDWRSIRAALGRVDLNRSLPRYPEPAPDTNSTGRRVITDLAGFDAAQRARQRFAKDIWDVLTRATGANRNATAGGDYDALRWLAQLAANIVDFIDYDDFNTPFYWRTPDGSFQAGVTDVVFGTELPRVLLNEVYAEAGNDPTSMKVVGGNQAADKYYKGNVWLELVHPFLDDSAIATVERYNGPAYLEMPPTKETNADGDGTDTYPIYQVVIAATNAARLAALKTNLQKVDNSAGDHGLTNTLPGAFAEVRTLGDPPAFGQKYFRPAAPADAAIGKSARAIRPLGTSFGAPEADNAGFYVLGPTLTTTGVGAVEFAPFPSPTGKTFESLRRAEMTVNFPVGTTAADKTKFASGDLTTSVLLRRLACPNLPPQPDPTMPGYNPYITVDKALGVRTHFAPKFDVDGAMGKEEAVDTRASQGRWQPYAEQTRTAQQPKTAYPATGTDAQPQHSFFQHNLSANTPVDGMSFNRPNPSYISGGTANRAAPPDYPQSGKTFDWLAHLDRQVISPMELLSVSLVRPHELTQNFANAAGTAHQHALATQIFNDNTRLYRAFEFLTTANRTQALSSLAIPLTLTKSGGGNITAGVPTTVTVSAAGMTAGTLSGVTPSGTRWSIEAGSVLAVDKDDTTTMPVTTNRENVMVPLAPATAVDTANQKLTLTFAKAHTASVTAYLTRIDHRIPGKININTVQDAAVLKALAAASTANGFDDAAVMTVFNNLVAARDAATPRPFRSLGVGELPASDAQFPQLTAPQHVGLDDTILRRGAGGVPVFKVPSGTHPYQQYDLLTKVFNNLTTRSNVFAVWLTVGFFKVEDATSRPVKLGEEIGKAQGRNVRHRMFAIVDRTNIPLPVAVGTTSQAFAAGGQQVTLPTLGGVLNLSAPFDDMTWEWSIKQGTWLLVDAGTAAEEYVQVTAVAAGSAVVVNFMQPHAKGASIYVAGYNGPQPKFDLRNNRAVVPYFSVID